MKQLWPPPPLGFGTPLNLALGRGWKRSLGLAVVVGVAAPLLILLLDRLLFAGASLERVRTLGAQPFATRILIVVVSAVTEELIYRVVVSTLVAWLSYLILKRQTASIWIGIAVAAVLFGLSHVANLQVPHPFLRAITLNGTAGVLLGWLYWRRGLEWAVLAHLVADAVLYLVLPATLSP
jgi:membrane protease YdiL (CAAX protease family)